MAKGSGNRGGRPPGDATTVGPPFLILGLGYASVLVSAFLLVIDGIGFHVAGYVTGSIIPILVVGLVRRIDLDRRRSPYYRPNKVLAPALAVLGVLAVITAGLHVWPIATELAS